MTISVEIPEALQRFSRLVKPAGRRMLFSAAGNAVSNLINRHLKRISPTRHRSANRLGATPTGHLEQRPTFHATSNYAEVVIPIPGINRAFKDLTITPKDAPFLTLPLNAVSYGKRAATVRSLGYVLFRPPAKGAHKADGKRYDRYQNILMGTKDGETAAMYLLKTRVEQRRDPTLLPTEAEIGHAAAAAMAQTIRLMARGAA